MQSPTKVLDQIDAALDDAAQLAIECCRTEDVSTWAVRLQRIRAKVDALACSAAVAVGRAELPGRDGHRSVATYMSARTTTDVNVFATDVRLGSWLADFPVFSSAFSSGEISGRHVAALRRLDTPRSGSSLAEAQEYLVDAARGCTWQEFNQVVRYWVLGGDPDGAEPVEQHAKRFCRYRKLDDGSVAGAFQLDPLAGHAFVTAIESESQRLFRQENHEPSPSGSSPGLTSAAQRRADAFSAVVTRGADRCTSGPPATLVHIVMSKQVAEATLAAVDTPTDQHSIKLHPTDIDGRCELVDGTPLHPRAAIGALAAATLRRLVMSSESESIDLGRRVRGFPEHLKQALMASARGRCQHPGCDAPITWLEADHVMPWNRAGPTALPNGQMLCGPHNRAKSDGEPHPRPHPPPPPHPCQPTPPPQPDGRQSSPPGGRE